MNNSNLEWPEPVEGDFEVVPQKDTKEYRTLQKTATNYLHALGKDGVHSGRSLLASRNQANELVDRLSGTHREIIIGQLIDQELKLQESIRHRSYVDKEEFATARKFLVKIYTWVGVIATIAIVPLAIWVFKDQATRDLLLGFWKWFLGSTTLIIVAHFFTKDSS